MFVRSGTSCVCTFDWFGVCVQAECLLTPRTPAVCWECAAGLWSSSLWSNSRMRLTLCMYHSSSLVQKRTRESKMRKKCRNKRWHWRFFICAVTGSPRSSGGWSCVLWWRSWLSTRRATTSPTPDSSSTSYTIDQKTRTLRWPCEGPRCMTVWVQSLCMMEILWGVSLCVVNELLLQHEHFFFLATRCVHVLLLSFLLVALLSVLF